MIVETALVAAVTAVAWFAAEKRKRRTGPVSPGLNADVLIPWGEPFELYHNDLSLCSKKLRLCMDELGIAYRSHHVDLIETGSYENLSREFLAVNPHATVPVLVHEGHPVYESHEQIVYAAAHCGHTTELLPGDPELRSRMQLWIDRSSIIGDNPLEDLHASAGNCVPAMTIPLFAAMIRDIPTRSIVEGLLFHWHKLRPIMFLALKAAGLARIGTLGKLTRAIEQSRTALETHFDTMEAELERTGGPWILGATFTLADVSWAVIFERLAEAGWTEFFPSDRWPLLGEYWTALRSRPSYQTAIVAHRHPAVVRGTERIVEEKRVNRKFTRTIYGLE